MHTSLSDLCPVAVPTVLVRHLLLYIYYSDPKTLRGKLSFSRALCIVYVSSNACSLQSMFLRQYALLYVCIHRVMLRQATTKLAPSLSLIARRPVAASLGSGSHFSTTVARGYEYIIAEKKGEKDNVGLVTLNR